MHQLDKLSGAQKLWLILAAIVAVYALYVRAKNKNATATTTASSTAGTASSDTSGGAVSQPDNTGLIKTITDLFTNLNTNANANAQGLSTMINESTKATTDYLQAQTGSIAGAFANEGAAIAAYQKATTDAIGGITGSVSGAVSGVGAQVTALGTKIDSVNAGVTQNAQSTIQALTGVTQADGKQTRDAVTAMQQTLTSLLSGNAQQIQQTVTALIADLKQNESALFNQMQSFITNGFEKMDATQQQIISGQAAQNDALAKLSTADYYNLGSHGLAACFDNNGISVDCARGQGRYEAGQKDGDQNWIRQYLQTTYGSCLKNGKYDAVCVGKIMAQNGGFGQ